jgi:hypothetical protein
MRSGIAGIGWTGWTMASDLGGRGMEETIGVSQSAMSVHVGLGSICQICVVQPSPLLALTVSGSLRTIVGDLTGEMATRPGTKSPLPMFNTAHGKVMSYL